MFAAIRRAKSRRGGMYAGRGLNLAKLKQKPRKSVTSVTDCAWLYC